jgi:cell division protein ZapE
VPEGPLDVYHSLTGSGRFLPDPAQLEVAGQLDTLWRELVAREGARWWRWPGKRGPVRGIYLWGDVGRGKTWLMDLFFDSLPFRARQRIHFHRFMARVHAALRAHGSTRDPLKKVARDWSRRCRLLCFDELFVSDIADAMLLGTLLDELFQSGVTLVATSNVHPDNLYEGGLQRARFLPAIESIKKNTRVVRLEGDRDFRLRILERSEIYHCPLDQEADSVLAESFGRMAGGCDLGRALEVNGRELTARKRGDGVIWFDFEELCAGPRSAADYIEISRSFNTVFISGLPVLREQDADEARRFISLVDEFYDRNVKLLISAEAPVDEIYRGERLAFEFSRTASRLHEMQTHDYLAKPHLP